VIEYLSLKERDSFVRLAFSFDEVAIEVRESIVLIASQVTDSTFS